MGRHVMKRVSSRLLRSARRALVHGAIAVDPVPYQPIGDSLRQGARSRSSFEIRLAHVVRQVEETGARNLLDIGCSEGFFVRQVVKKTGVFALGIDSSETRLNIATGVAEIYGEQGYGFVKAKADAEMLRKIPQFDITLCFSMLHWVVRDSGVQGAQQFIKELARITRYRMIFDMGSPEEEGIVGEGRLADFDGDVVSSTANFLSRSGFSKVEHVADTDGAQREKKRPLFVCSP